MLKKFPNVEDHVNKSLDVRKEIFTRKLASISRKRFLTKATQRPSVSSPKKLLKSGVYFLNMISKKSRGKKPFDTLNDEDKPRNSAVSSALSWARSSMTPKSGILGVLKNLKKSDDSNEKKRAESITSQGKVDVKKVSWS